MGLQESFQQVLSKRQTCVEFLEEKKKELDEMRAVLQKRRVQDIFEVTLAEDKLTIEGNGYMIDLEYCIKKKAEIEAQYQELRPEPLVNGKDLIAMGFKPGPQFKKTLDEVYESQLNGELSSKQETKKFALNLHAKI